MLKTISEPPNRYASSDCLRVTIPNSLLLSLEERAPKSTRFVVGLLWRVGLDLHVRLRRLDGCGLRPRDLEISVGLVRFGLERHLDFLELFRILLAKQLADELAQLLGIEAIAGDQRVEIGGEMGGTLIAVGDVARECLEADRVE